MSKVAYQQQIWGGPLPDSYCKIYSTANDGVEPTSIKLKSDGSIEVDGTVFSENDEAANVGGRVIIGSGGFEGGLDPSKLGVMEGAGGTPASAAKPTVVISRLSSGTNEENDNALSVIQLADDASTTQTGCVQASIFGGANSNDQVAFSGVALTASTHNAFGMFFQAKATATGGGAWGCQTDTQNLTGTAVPYTNGVNQNKFVGLDVVFNTDDAGGGLDSGVAVQVRASTSSWDVGIGFQGDNGIPGILTSVVDDNTNAVNIWVDTGAHTNGFDLSGATFSGSQIKLAMGTSLTNAANDAAAAGAGVPVGGVYRNGSVLMVRVA